VFSLERERTHKTPRGGKKRQNVGGGFRGLTFVKKRTVVKMTKGKKEGAGYDGG